jgi:hypothetical protein
MSDGRRATGGGEPAVVEALPRLKREGCNLLVTGAVSEATTCRATRRLFGSSTIERKRILVRTADAPAVDDLLPTGVDASDPSVRVIDASAYAAERDPLDALGEAVSAAVDEFCSRSPPLVGGELRLAFVSLDSLAAGHGRDSIDRFLRRITDAIATARGMGHYRYGSSRDDTTRPSDDLFDGFVDLRERSRPEQRLSISEVGPTDWTSL